MLETIISIFVLNKLFVMSLLGSLVAALFQRINKAIPLLTAIVGGLAATYICAPLVGGYFPGFDLGAIGLILGMVGSNVISAILKIGEYLSRNAVTFANKYLKHKLNLENGETEEEKPIEDEPKKLKMGDIKDIDTRR